MQLSFVGGIVEEGALLGSSPVGCLGMCECGGAEVSMDVNVRELGSASVVWRVGMAVTVMGLRAWAAGDGFQALHWNVLSWSEFGRCTRVLRVFHREWVVRIVMGGGVCWV